MVAEVVVGGTASGGVREGRSIEFDLELELELELEKIFC